MTQKRVLLVGWDGADWKVAKPLMNQGHMPQLNNMVANGASGNLASFPPYLSPMLWNTIATGKQPHKHGICGFSEVDPHTSKIRPVSSLSRQCKAIWNILTEQGKKCHVLGWFASHPAEPINGICVSEVFARPSGRIGAEWPVPKASLYPPEKTLDLAAIRVAPEDVDKILLDFLVPRHREIKPPMGRRIDQLLVRLAELYTIHNAAIEIVQTDNDFDFLGVYYHFLDWVSHDFMEFHPPRQEHINETLYDIFKEVVANAYRLQDILLRDLIHHAGPGSTVMVISDHGFHCDHLRPKVTPNVTAGIASWHRPYGIITMAGPGVDKATLTGARLADITPSILHYLGLPIGEDMDGRVLSKLFTTYHEPRYIPSWETKEPLAPQSMPNPTDWNAADEALLLQQFEQLGYIDPADPDDDFAIIRTRCHNAWNMGVALRAMRLNEAALPYLEEAYFHAPEQISSANQLAQCQLSLGMIHSAEATIQTILDLGEDRPIANLLMATVEFQKGNFQSAWNYLERVEDKEEHIQQLSLRRGFTLIALQEYAAAETALQKVLAANPDEPRAHLGQAQALFALKRYDEAAFSAGQAITLEHNMIEAYIVLGMISECQKNWDVAEDAYNCALSMAPKHPGVLFRLSDLAARQTPHYTENLLQREQQFEAMLQQQSKAQPAKIKSLEEAAQKRFKAMRTKREELRKKMSPVTQLYGKNHTYGSSGKTFFIVSGLPRSGTSLMMQMLAKGGLPPMTDGKRTADIHNPKGYLEWEAAKQLPKEPKLIETAEGKAVKIISMLIPYLPREHRYKIIFMDRELEEVAASQQQMISLGGQTAMEKDKAVKLLQEHRENILKIIQSCPNVDYLKVDYASLFKTVKTTVLDQITEFIGREWLPNSREMINAIDKQLYRQNHSQA